MTRPNMPDGSIRVGGFTMRPKVTVAWADAGMGRGQQWVVRGGDHDCVAHIPADKWVVIYNPEDPVPDLDE
jgi:hypothetical protein